MQTAGETCNERRTPRRSPSPEYGFAGLNPGDPWSLCAGRFLRVADQGHAPKVYLAATHRKALDVVPIDVLQAYDQDAD